MLKRVLAGLLSCVGFCCMVGVMGLFIGCVADKSDICAERGHVLVYDISSYQNDIIDTPDSTYRQISEPRKCRRCGILITQPTEYKTIWRATDE